jgi:hypothetical protein
MAQIEAAKESKRVVVDLTMTIEEARKVIWTGRGPHEPMGDLFDSRQINASDLAWAIDKAFNPQVRAAAQALLANWLGKPATIEATRRFGPEVVEGSHYLEEQETDGMAQFIIYMMGGLFLAIFVVPSSLLQILSNKTNPIPLPIAIAVNLTVALICGLWLYKKIKQAFARWKNSGRGRKGEQTVVDRLRTILDNRWTIFRNLHLPDRKDDVDIVLVGPGGVWAVEIKAFRENVRSQNGAWEWQTKRGWKKLEQNPSRQVTENAKRLNFYLQQQGITRWVERAVALAEPQPIQNFQSEIPIWFLPTLENAVSNLTTRTPPSEEEIKRIAGLFKELATKQVAIEEAKYKKS